jgi:hypothetical protein
MNNKLQNLEKTITSILTRHGLDVVKESENTLSINKPTTQKASSYNTLIYAGIGIMVGAIVVLFIFEMARWRVIAIFIGVIVTLATQLSKQKKTFDSLYNSVIIEEGRIEIVNHQNETVSYSSEEIDKVEIVIPRRGDDAMGHMKTDEDLFYGRIYLLGESIEDVQLFELFSAQRRYLEDDLNKIADYILMRIE